MLYGLLLWFSQFHWCTVSRRIWKVVALYWEWWQYSLVFWVSKLGWQSFAASLCSCSREGLHPSCLFSKTNLQGPCRNWQTCLPWTKASSQPQTVGAKQKVLHFFTIKVQTQAHHRASSLTTGSNLVMRSRPIKDKDYIYTLIDYLGYVLCRNGPDWFLYNYLSQYAMKLLSSNLDINVNCNKKIINGFG